MRVSVLVAAAAATLVLAEPASHACVELQEANKLLGWSADGTRALHARVDGDGKIEHAEIMPTRFEGEKLVIVPDGRFFVVKKTGLDRCEIHEATVVERVRGPLTEAALRDLAVVKAMKLVAPPADDGGAAKLAAAFVPRKRYAEHKLVIKDGAGAVVDTLTVPVWCFGSCLRDEDWKRWGARVLAVATTGDRKLYVVRMARVCNGGNDREMWIDRVIAVPGTEPPPPRRRCRGTG